jgi:hypothetical protein
MMKSVLKWSIDNILIYYKYYIIHLYIIIFIIISLHLNGKYSSSLSDILL